VGERSIGPTGNHRLEIKDASTQRKKTRKEASHTETEPRRTGTSMETSTVRSQGPEFIHAALQQRGKEERKAKRT